MWACRDGFERRSGREQAAILDAAWDLFAQCGPDGASLRDVGTAASCTHALVARYYGSKLDLVGAVASTLATRVDGAVGQAITTANDPLRALLGAARTHRPYLQLLIRSALGDLPPRGFPACLRVEWLLSQTAAASSGHVDRNDGYDRRARLCAYAAASLLLGFATFEGFLVAATRLGPLSARRRDAALAGAARHVLGLATAPEPRLAPRDLSTARALVAPVDPSPSAPAALLRAAVEVSPSGAGFGVGARRRPPCRGQPGSHLPPLRFQGRLAGPSHRAGQQRAVPRRARRRRLRLRRQ